MVANFKKKGKRNSAKKFLLHTVGVAAIILLVVLVVVDVMVYKRRQELHFQVSNLEQQIKDIQTSNDNLTQKIQNQDNPQYMEKIAREELDLQRQGEKAVSFIMPETLPQNTEASQKNPWSKWFGNVLNMITGKK